jgi:diguanylate cyclase (GGDEF)-like protein/PAS domain S-box-containing protein
MSYSEATSVHAGELQDGNALRELVQRLREGIYVTNRNGEILDANPAFLEMLGLTSVEQLRAVRVSDVLVDPRDRERELEILAREGAVREYELRIRARDGQVRTVLDSAYAREQPETGETYFYGILVDITERKQLEEKLLEQSVRDPLTGSFNRRYLDFFEREQDRLRRGWGCIATDIDHFKQYNDRYGHHVGDQALIQVSRYLWRNTRAEEGVVRMGGDEFLVLLAGADQRQTETAARRLLEGAGELGIPFSLGWAARDGEEPLDRTIQRADQRLLEVRLKQRPQERRARA